MVTLALLERMVAGQLLRKGGALKGLLVVHFFAYCTCCAFPIVYMGRGAQRVGVNALKNQTSASKDT